MQAILNFIQTHLYDIFIPLTALSVLRIIVCLIQLRHTAALRRKKGKYHAVSPSYTEIGAWLGILIGLILVLITRLWYVGTPLAVILGILGCREGKRRGAAADSVYREVALELKQEAAAEAARECASHTLSSGEDDAAETTENKGDTENG